MKNPIPGLEVRLTEEGTSARRAEVVLPPEVVRAAFNAELRAFRQRARMPGYRRGKIPMDVVEREYGERAAQRVTDALARRAAAQALHQLKAEPLAPPEVQVRGAVEEGSLTLDLAYDVWPRFRIDDFDGLEVRERKTEITESAIGDALEQIREQKMGTAPIGDRGLEDGDVVRGTLTEVEQPTEADATPDSSPVVTEDLALLIGDDSYHAGLHEALLGRRIGDTVETTVSFGGDSPDRRRAGRTLRVSFEVKTAAVPVLPPIDDELARGVGARSLLALRGDVRDRLRERAAAEDRRLLRDRVVQALLERAPLQAPRTLVERELDERMRIILRGIAAEGVDPAALNEDWSERRSQLRPDAERAVAAAIMLEKLAIQEAIPVPEDAVDAEIERIAAKEKKSAASVRAALAKDGRLDAIRLRARRESAIDFLLARARVIPEAPSPPELP